MQVAGPVVRIRLEAYEHGIRDIADPVRKRAAIGKIEKTGRAHPTRYRSATGPSAS